MNLFALYQGNVFFRSVACFIAVLLVAMPLYLAAPTAEAGGGGGGIGGFVKSFTKSFTSGKGIAAMLIGMVVGAMLPPIGLTLSFGLGGSFSSIGVPLSFGLAFDVNALQVIGGTIVSKVAEKALGGNKNRGSVGPSASESGAAGENGAAGQGSAQRQGGAGGASNITGQIAQSGGGTTFAGQRPRDCTFVVRPLRVTRGEDAAAGWSCTTTGARGIGFTIETDTASGTAPIEQPQRTQSYGVMCANSCEAYAILTVDDPALSLSVSSDLVRGGDIVTVTWSASLPEPEEDEEPPTCSVSGPGLNANGLSGSAQSGPIVNESTFTLSCGALSESVIVRLAPAFNEL